MISARFLVWNRLRNVFEKCVELLTGGNNQIPIHSVPLWILYEFEAVLWKFFGSRKSEYESDCLRTFFVVKMRFWTVRKKTIGGERFFFNLEPAQPTRLKIHRGFLKFHSGTLWKKSSQKVVSTKILWNSLRTDLKLTRNERSNWRDNIWSLYARRFRSYNS